MTKLLNGITALLLTATLAAPASATIVGGAVTGFGDPGAAFVILDPAPGQVGLDNQESIDLYGFNEGQNIPIAAQLGVDVGTNPQAGDIVASHYVFFDPANRTQIQGYVDFDSDIFGIITSTNLLIASDFLISNGVTYNSPALRGLEPNEDFVSIGLDDDGYSRRLYIDFTADSPGDYVRVLTTLSPGADIPEPGMIAIFGLALAGLGLRMRRRS